jgi:hypothetical protein
MTNYKLKTVNALTLKFDLLFMILFFNKQLLNFYDLITKNKYLFQIDYVSCLADFQAAFVKKES